MYYNNCSLYIVIIKVYNRDKGKMSMLIIIIWNKSLKPIDSQNENFDSNNDCVFIIKHISSYIWNYIESYTYIH